MQREIEVRCYGRMDEFRFKFNITVPVFSIPRSKSKKEVERKRQENKQRKIAIILRKSRKEIRKIRREFSIKAYGCSFDKIKSIVFENMSLNL